MKKTPLQIVKDRFETKEKLVEAVQELCTEELFLLRVNEVKGLEKCSNAKLLRLHEVLSHVKQNWGSRTKLIDAILELEKRSKDQGLRGKLESRPTPELLDLHKSAARRAKRAAQKPVAPAVPAKKKARSKKAKAKARAAA